MKKFFLFFILYIILTFIILAYSFYIFYIHIPFILYLLIPALPFILGIICFKTNKNKVTKKENIYLVVLSVFISLFLIYSFNIYKHNIPVRVNLELSTTHTKAEQSTGYNIPVILIKFDDLHIKFNWVKKSGEVIEKETKGQKYLELISNKNNPAKIKIKNIAADKIHILFNGGNDSGIALLKINNKKYLINTFQPNIETDDQHILYYSKLFNVNLNKNLSLKQKINKFLYIISYFLIFMFSVYFIGCIILNTNIYTEEKLNVSKFKILIYMLPIIVMGIIYLLIFYPAIMSFDSLVQWKYIHTNIYGNEHPIFHTYLIGQILKIWHSPASAVIFQISCFAFIIGYFFFKLEKLSVSGNLLLILSCLIAITPYNDLMIISLWKDVIFSIALLLLTFCSLFIVIERNNFFKSKLNILLFILSLIFVSLTRYNGIYTSVLTVIFLIIFMKDCKISLIKYAITFIILSAVILLFIKSQVKTIEYNFIYNQTFEVPIAQIHSVFHEHGKISEKEKAILSEIEPLYIWENQYFKYYPHSYIFTSENLLNNKLNPLKLFKVYLSLLKSNFLIMFKEFLDINSYILIYKSDYNGHRFVQWNVTEIENNDILTIKYNLKNKNIVNKSFFPNIKKHIQIIVDSEYWNNLFYKATIYFFILIIFGSLFIIKNGLNYLLGLLPVILTLFFLSISLPEMCTRYVFILFLIYPIIILLSLTKIKN